MKTEPEFEQQQPATAFHAPTTGGQIVAPVRIPLGPEFDALAARGAPGHAAGAVQPTFDPPPHFAAALPPAFEAYARHCAPLSPIRPGGR